MVKNVRKERDDIETEEGATRREFCFLGGNAEEKSS